ncbi:uncharacterized protein LOC134740132 [Pongo pygmaeus]|uniref:uncharacterized protein LOC134740132 n=1 Tax=Pongo pygmaeus TaxID=9600 RepID=UPI00300D36C4
MGCCFSKELSSDSDSEKTGLLQKSVEEKEPENKISKSLSSLFDPLEGEEVHRIGSGASSAAGVSARTRIFAGSGHKQGHRPKQLLNPLSSFIYTFLTRYENLDENDKNSNIVVNEQNSEGVCDLLCVGNGSRQGCWEDEEPFSCVLVPSDRGLQEETFVSGHLHCYPATCKNSLVEKEMVVSIHLSSGDESKSLDLSDREKKDGNPIGIDDQQCQDSGECKFHSICVADSACRSMAEELGTWADTVAARGECCSAVPSALRAVSGVGEPEPRQEELSPWDTLGPGERTEECSGKTKPCPEPVAFSHAPCEANADNVQVEALQAEACTEFPKNYAESSALHGIDLLPELNNNMDSDSLRHACVLEESESHNSGVGSEMDHPPGGFRTDTAHSPGSFCTDTAYVAGSDDPEVVTVIVDQSLHSKKERENNSITPLRDNNDFYLDVNKSDSILPIGLDRIDLSPKRPITAVRFGSGCLSGHANSREAAPSQLDDCWELEPVPGQVRKAQRRGDCSLDARSPLLPDRGPCGTSESAHHFRGGNAKPTLTQSTLNCEMGFMGNAKVSFEKIESRDASSGHFFLVGVDPTLADRYTAAPCDAAQGIPAVPVDSKDTVVPSSGHIVSFTEGVLNRCEHPSKVDWQSFPEGVSRFLSEFSYYPMGGLGNPAFSERLASGCGGYQMGYLWTNTVTKGALEGETVFSEDLHHKPQALEIALFSENTPQLLVSEDGVVWGWHDRDGQFVSMFSIVLQYAGLYILIYYDYYFYLFFETESCFVTQVRVARSRLTATSTSEVQVIAGFK